MNKYGNEILHLPNGWPEEFKKRNIESDDVSYLPDHCYNCEGRVVEGEWVWRARITQRVVGCEGCVEELRQMKGEGNG